MVFIRHHTAAEEVDEDNFFHLRETGGTMVSECPVAHGRHFRALQFAASWNIYGAQASDGDNWNDDSPHCRQLSSESILPCVQYFAYIEITEGRPRISGSNTSGWKEIHPTASPCNASARSPTSIPSSGNCWQTAGMERTRPRSPVFPRRPGTAGGRRGRPGECVNPCRIPLLAGGRLHRLCTAATGFANSPSGLFGRPYEQRKSAPLPKAGLDRRGIERYDVEIGRVWHYELDCYRHRAGIITAEQMMDAYTPIGMPVYYHHWSFDKHFLETENRYKRGQMGLAHEIVINSDPCIAT